MKPATPKIDGITMEHKLAPQMVVFSHGFGVRRDGGGLLAELAATLPAGFGYVLFDYNDFHGKTGVISDFSEQVRRLTAVIAWTKSQPGVTYVHVVAHSMGCITTALAKSEISGQFVLLASPLVIGERTRTYFTSKLGAKKDGDRWTFPRSDGTTSIVSISLFDEIEGLDAQQALLKFAGSRHYTFVVAGRDELLGQQDYAALSKHLNVDLVTIVEADHNFKGKSRKKLTALINRLIQ